MNLRKKSRGFLADTSGATAIEYGLIALLIAIPIIAIVTALGLQISDFFDSVAAWF